MAINVWENKLLQIIAGSTLIYFIWMDVAFYHKIQAITLTTGNVTLHPQDENSFSPMAKVAMKTLLLDHLNHYIYLPLAVIFNKVTNFSETFYFITPNMISGSHVILSLFAIRFFGSSRLSLRQVGFMLFQVRFFLDALDGTVARARAHHSISYLDMNSSGFILDGVCDAIGSAAFYFGAFIFLCSNSAPSLMRLKNRDGQVLIPLINTLKSGDRSSSVDLTSNITNSNVLHVRNVVIVLICSGLQMLFGSIFWNQTLGDYHSLLETEVPTHEQKVLQLEIFKSSSLWIIAWFWKVFNPQAMLEVILISVFMDKLWEFLRWTQYTGFVVLIVLATVTNAHIHYARGLIMSAERVEA
ncbi:ceramide phosphoethanolamine synthase-like [Ischnura elegans]|uniref:ceramide phosphoethanolamine synthase-like n=1 Tax=Ischnura elegans TaxID=197161 RepID=UPI001ED8B0A0|nr:ceramide phosphoethanolamine synthase-like [Ischnura elegans]XP_046389179.1 ceramide phosphoethanolamine synthase-like [Ischnura elegans]XP_046389180.1 ceramide phosphoethanolamine synthase-like [Ischnura elegans]XP_046389181.1 ceramide phosphoethanolamine synthase-like [Ischnura elegans]XP_046389182.1 ceramide phosphoethanolamine synthase-like [Ischnura elegans]XP_046389183.1 ceramide phosphoethanolamine synthase-like [Ischnura elegans]XP_046389184.1 ceramide phosphoethanolamine synthase-